MVPHTYSASTCSLSPSLSATLSGLLPSTRSCCRTYSCTSRCAVSYLSVLFVLRQHSTTRARREEGVRLIQRRVGPLTMEGCLGHFRRHNKFEKVCAQVLFLHEDQPVRSAATGFAPPPPPLSLCFPMGPIVNRVLLSCPCGRSFFALLNPHAPSRQ